MCGIVGLVGVQEESWLERMNAAQSHRGPDDAGLWRDHDRNVGLGMRRLAIVDLSDGVQPMTDESEQHILVFNGEIFNAPGLRRELEECGAIFTTDHSDTEVILEGYRFWGESVVERLNGMFAFVIFDRARQVLFGARDPAGIKPLYLLHSDQGFAFASELKSLLELPWLKRSAEALDLESLSHYLTLQFIPAPRTILKGVRKLAAGHSFKFSLRGSTLVQRQYWTPPTPGTVVGKRAEIVEQIRARLKLAVERWLMSDVPVGCSLSGGIDSAAVVGIMTSLGAQGIPTWTLGFREAGLDNDERVLARAVARRWNTDHTEVVISAEEVLADLPQMARCLDEPYGGGLPAWYVFRAMRGHVKVAMTGTGGDELFGNYDKWRAHRLLTPFGFRRALGAMSRHGISKFVTARHGALYHGYTGDAEKADLLRSGGQPIASTAELIARHWREGDRRDAKDAVAAVDFRCQLPDEFLHMTDRFSMAWSIEARTPFLDRELVEFVLALPASIRVDTRVYKGLLREVVEPWLPTDLLAAPKRGFVLPMRKWTRDELRPTLSELLGASFLRDQGLFDPLGVSTILGQHLDGGRDATDLIWTLMMFQFWWKSFVTARASGLRVGDRCA